MPNIKLALIGNATIAKLVQKKCFDAVEVISPVIAANPVTLYTRPSDTPLPQEITDFDLDATKRLVPYLRRTKADAVLVNLEYVKKAFYYAHGTFYTDSTFRQLSLADAADYRLHEPTKFGHQIDKYPAESALILEGIRRLGSELREVFRPDQIFLMSCISPEFFVVGNNLVKNSWFIKYNAFLQAVEQAFCAVTQCFVWDFAAKRCPLQKTGPTLLSSEYYPPFYDEVPAMLPTLLACDAACNRPSLRYYIQLQRAFQNDIINRKNVGTYIKEPHNAVLDMLYNTSPETIEVNYEVFARYYARDLSWDEMLQDATGGNIVEVLQVLKCYRAITDHDYFAADVTYHLMFKYKFSILTTVVGDVQAFCNRQGVTVTVTKNNLAYYFAYMQLRHHLDSVPMSNLNSALKNLVLFANNKNINVCPTKVDIWGACISRFIFNTNERDFKVNRYLYHVDPLAVMADIHLDRPLPKTPTWEQNMAIYQIQGRAAFDQLFANKADWIVIDNFSMTAPNHFLTPFGYIQSPDVNFAANTLHLTQNTRAYLDIPFADLIPGLDKYIDWLVSRYGNNIIFVKLYYHNYYVDFTGRIQDFSFRKQVWGVADSDPTILDELNALSEKMANYVIERTGCYVVDLANRFLPDERSFSELHHLHHEKTFFTEAAKIVNLIIHNRPTMRHYDQYAPEAKVDRYIRLVGKNPDHPYLPTLFGGHWLDALLLQLPLQAVVQHRDALVALYNKPYVDWQQMVVGSDGSTELGLLLAQYAH